MVLNLAAAIVGAGLTGILAIVMTRLLSDSSKHQKSIGMKNDVESVKMVLMRRVDCQSTLSPLGSSCIPGSLVELREKRDGKIQTLIKDNDPPTRFGKIAVRAECSSDGSGVMVKYAWLKDGKSIKSTNPSDFYRDPVFNDELSWDNDKKNRLFQTGLNLCTFNNSSAALPVCYVARACGRENQNRRFTVFAGQKLSKNDLSNIIMRGQKAPYDPTSYGKKIECTNFQGDDRVSLCGSEHYFSGLLSEVCSGMIPDHHANGQRCAGMVPDKVLCCKK